MKDEALTLETKDAGTWQNETGFSTAVLVDLQVLFACKRAASNSAWGADDKIFAADCLKAQCSTRLSLNLRQNAFLKSQWAEVAKQGSSVCESDAVAKKWMKLGTSIDYLCGATSLDADAKSHINSMRGFIVLADQAARLKKEGDHDFTQEVKAAKAKLKTALVPLPSLMNKFGDQLKTREQECVSGKAATADAMKDLDHLRLLGSVLQT